MERKQRINYRYLSLILGMLLIAGNIFAQLPQRGGMQGPPPLPDSAQIAKMVDELSKEISLSENQKVNVLELFTDHFNEVKAAMNNQKNQRGNREEMDKLRSNFENKVKSLLNDEQKAGFEEFMDNHGPQQQQRPNR